jgi:hypothetical protein
MEAESAMDGNNDEHAMRDADYSRAESSQDPDGAEREPLRYRPFDLSP